MEESQAFRTMRAIPARAINPVPSNPSVPGSGTVVMIVSPLPKATDPVNPFLPALNVICVVAPFTVVPLYQVPEIAPVSV